MSAEWVAEEMQHLKLKDARLTKRVKQMMASLSEGPTETIPEACENWAGTKGAYRLLENERVDEAQIRTAHYQSTSERLVGAKRVLAIQDTTELDYTGKVVGQELGYMSSVYSQGLLMHSVLIVSEAGVPQGLVDQKIWHRDPSQVGKAKARRDKETREKESNRWLEAVQATEKRVPAGIEIVHIADREGDIYDLLALKREKRSQMLIRMTHNRRVEEGYVWEAIRAVPIAGEMTVEVTAQANRPARLAQVSVRFCPLTVCPPHKGKGEGVRVQYILAEEHDTPPGQEQIVWLLATTLPVDSLEDAMECVALYHLRWLIERFHFVLKSGCGIEKLYLQTTSRLLRALAIFSIVAWRVLWLTYETRSAPDQPCSVILETHEWQALYCTIHKTPFPPSEPPTLEQAVRWIARLGGFLDRKHDGAPGVKTIWRGLRRLEDIAETWRLLHTTPPPLNQR